MTESRKYQRVIHQLSLCAYLFLLCALLVQASPTTKTEVSSTANTTTPATNNYNCPADCQCVLAKNTHTPLLHAKCSSLEGLRSYAPTETSLPIHSLDLSYLSLKRLSHPLEKLPDVTSIDLSHNELHEVGHLGRRIKKLNLKHNRISSSKLNKLPAHLQVLNLQHNDITYLPLDLTRLSNLVTLELSHNQINCSCETLDVRNWLQERHVFMEHAVTCEYPITVKGKPWLQVKQSDICGLERSGRLADEADNELMMGDQPVEGSGDQDDEDELGKAYLPIDMASASKANMEHLNEVEGSGDLSDMNAPINLAMTTVAPDVENAQEHVTTEKPQVAAEEEENEDGSGSGAGPLIIPAIAHDPHITDDFEAPDEDDKDDAFDHKPVPQPAAEEVAEEKEEEVEDGEPKSVADVFSAGMGIFEEETEAPSAQPVTEDAIVPIKQHNLEAEDVDGVSTEGATSGEPSAILTANVGSEAKDDSNATYFLLAVLGLIVVGLILFVGIKRCKQHQQAAHDAENPRQTELLDMDKKQLGKPLRNGTEHSPLIGDKTKSDFAKPINGGANGTKKPYDSNDVKDGAGQQPLLNGSNGTAPNEHVEQEYAPPATEAMAPPHHEYHPITPRYPTPKSPRASKYAQYPQLGAEHNNNNIDSYLPSSPKSGRYSPVYSPETGRVKIKLTETPRPKTPMLVTRSKSNAGDIVTTPVVPTTVASAAANGIDNSLIVPGVHAAPAAQTLVNGH